MRALRFGSVIILLGGVAASVSVVVHVAALGIHKTEEVASPVAAWVAVAFVVLSAFAFWVKVILDQDD